MKNLLLILALAVALGGCFGGYPNYYILTAEGPPATGGGKRVGVGPVTLAYYVDRENLVIQTGPNKVEVAEDHLWAGDLDASVMDVVAVNIGRQLNSGNTITYPWMRESDIDYQVVVDINQFLAGEDGYALVEAKYRIFKIPGSRLIDTNAFSGKEPIVSADYESMVAAQSKLLGRLSADIAAKIRNN